MSRTDALRRRGEQARCATTRRDGGGLAFVYKSHSERLRRLLSAQFSDSRDDRIQEEIEDAIQEAFCRMLEQRARGVERPGLKNEPAYLFTVARNHCIDGHRRRSRERSPPHHLLTPGAVETAEQQVERQENAARLLWLASHVSSLTGSLRSVYSARFVEGLSQVVAARRLGMTRRAVRTLERRLLVYVKRSLRAAALGVSAVAPNMRSRVHTQRPEAEARTSYEVNPGVMARRGRV